ncbi:uncharacterized protein LOC128224424 isoform X2 [Mya arenaria]|uniref:uncharacterized protein LOC128224424 isoform X2 n=1 Tax=Mya arenaria TaxID=6604 RepID=UPI0022E54147|nr:uncharacterized protein LOC128224424 isoform X2 [Mya arenaria]
MAVLSHEIGMTSPENHTKHDSSHEHNLYFDKQLQNRLLQVGEDLDIQTYESKLSKTGSNVKNSKSNKSENKAEDITGWFPSAKFVARRTDLGNSKVETKPANTFIHPWKDYRTKKEDSFVFKHYTEHRKYIDQYRNEHGCYNQQRSAGQIGEMRRVAFQTSNPQQQNPLSAQYVHHQQGWASSAPPAMVQAPPPPQQSSIQYTTRREQLGSLVLPNSNNTNNPTTSANCQCGSKTNPVVDHSSQSQLTGRYKLSPGNIQRTYTSADFRHTLDSDNSSESGDIRVRAPSRRSNSASSSRQRTVGKAPTKISVPATPNPRAYPIQALTIAWRLQRQQNGKSEVIPAPKPLDNLNCVAPEKQPSTPDRRNVDELGLALKVHSLNNLLTINDAPMRGYALPKSTPPNPNTSNMWFDASGRAYVSLASRYDPIRKY